MKAIGNICLIGTTILFITACGSDVSTDQTTSNYPSDNTEHINDSLAWLTHDADEPKKVSKDEEHIKERLKKKYQKIIDGCYENSSEERVFNSTKLNRKMKSIRFNQEGGNYSNNYRGIDSGFNISIKYGGAVASNHGWVQKWDISVDRK